MNRLDIYARRRWAPILGIWGVALALAGGLFWMGYTMPAITDLLPPVYVVIAAVLALVTWKWLRERARARNRRHGDRRHQDRREHRGARDASDAAAP